MRVLFLACSLVILSAACSSSESSEPLAPPPAPPATPTDPPRPPPVDDGPKLEKTACRFVVPKSIEGKTFYCADLPVPENRRDPSSKKIKIHVAVIKGKEGGLPTIELVGGPGGSSEGLVGGLAAREKKILAAYAPMLAQGDLVLFDQRGTGRSIPRLWCDMGRPGNPIPACRAELEKKGIDVAAYDTVENADDVHDLKLALGVPQVALHGISYGTRLGIEIIKRHGGDVHGAILDGVMPSDVPVLGGFEVAMDAILTRIFSACEKDTKCNATYPDLNGSFTRLKAKLDATPFEVSDPFGRGSFPYDWYAFVGDLIQRSYEEGTAERVPFWISDLLTKNQAAFEADEKKAMEEESKKFEEESKKEQAENPLVAEYEKLMEQQTEEDFLATDMAYGMYLSVTCNDYAQHESLEAAKAAFAKIRPELRDEMLVTDEFDSCKSWAVRPSDPTVRSAPNFAGPVLVIGGEMDPATPSTWAERVASTLPNDQLVKVPTGGHGLMDECGAALKGAFLGDPAKKHDASCATNRALKFHYAGGQGFHNARALVRPVIRPGATIAQQIADRVLAASRPSGLVRARRR